MAYNRGKYKYRKKNNLCVLCGEDAIKHNLYCFDHYILNKIYCNNNYQKNKKKRREYRHNQILKRKSKSLCITCGMPLDDEDNIICVCCLTKTHKRRDI